MAKRGFDIIKEESKEYKKNVQGLATIKAGEDKVLVTFKEEKHTFDNGKNSKRFELDDLPRYPKVKPNTVVEGRIRLNKDGDSIDSITPVRGHFPMKCVDFYRQTPDSDPSPYEKVWGEGTPQEDRHEEFFALYKIMSGAWKGATAPYFLHYKFVNNGHGEVGIKGNPENPKATRFKQLSDWCEIHELKPLPWPEDENVLPDLLDLVLETDVEVEGTFKDGYLKEIDLPQSQDSNDSDEEAEEDEKPVAKKAPAKKRPPKDEDEEEL